MALPPRGTCPSMGRGEQRETEEKAAQEKAAEPAPPAEEGTDPPYGMGLSSEHDHGKVQEVDSREQD